MAVRKYSQKQKTEIESLFNNLDYTNNPFYKKWYGLFEKGYLSDKQIDSLRTKVIQNNEMLEFMDNCQQNKDNDFFKSMYSQLTEKKWLSQKQYMSIRNNEDKYLRTKDLLENYDKKDSKIFESLETFFDERGFLTDKQIDILT